MNTMTRALLIACMTLSFVACKKEEAAPEAVVAAPLAAPTTDDAAAWKPYLQDVVPRHMEGITNPPYVYFLPGESTEDFQGTYDRLLEQTEAAVQRGIVKGNLIAYASPASAKMAELVETSFQGVPPNTMKGVRVLFIGKAEDQARVQAAVAPAGVEFVFVEAK